MPLLTTIRDDLRAKARWCYGNDRRRDVLRALATDGSASMILYRLMQWSRHRGLTPLEMIFNKLNSAFCHCVIGRGAEFGPEFVLIHSTGVVINAGVRGGRGVHLEHQVTIGAECGLVPVLESDLFIGAGARIIGDVTIGNGARVGANAVVLHDVPAHHTAVGVPARMIDHTSAPPAQQRAA